MSSNVLADRDTNATMDNKVATEGAKGEVKSMEYHRQVLQSKLEESKGQQTYVSPSDTIMSPCTAKLNAYKGKQVFARGKPKSLFAKASAKNLGSSGSMFGQVPTKAVSKPNSDEDQSMEG